RARARRRAARPALPAAALADAQDVGGQHGGAGALARPRARAHPARAVPAVRRADRAHRRHRRVDDARGVRAAQRLGRRAPRPRALLAALIALAHAMELVPVAQGVQLESQDTALRELGGDEVQGFRYSPPRPPDALDAVLAPGERAKRGRAIRVFLCDDVTEMRDMVRVALEQEPDLEVVGEASNGEAAARGVAESHPDVVLLDI